MKKKGSIFCIGYKRIPYGVIFFCIFFYQKRVQKKLGFWFNAGQNTFFPFTIPNINITFINLLEELNFFSNKKVIKVYT